ncbi:MAG: dockerin type I repeat-containing protein [Clostridia bacterium]|nr:dockerin type I repeat-containing protein [Clostridia bacterium]
MKKALSILLMCSMIFLSSISVFAAEAEAETYDISNLFVDYNEKSLYEMVKYISENQQVYGFIEYFRNHGLKPGSSFDFPEVRIYMSGNYKASEVFNAFYSRLTDEHSRYIVLNTSRPTTPEATFPHGTVMLGEKGNKCFYIDFTDEFFSYVNSLNRLDSNILIMDFLLNLLSGDVVGISFECDQVYYNPDEGDTFDSDSESYDIYSSSIIGDCNGDGAVNSIDGNLMRRIMCGNGFKVDPFAVDINRDGNLNAVDSFELKIKIAIG